MWGLIGHQSHTNTLQSRSIKIDPIQASETYLGLLQSRRARAGLS